MLRYRVHYATKVFAARTIHNKSCNAAIVVVSNLVALVALIVSYPILLLTNNNRMMISACLKNGNLKNYLSRRQRRQRQAKMQKSIVGKRPKPHIREHDQHSFNWIRVLLLIT